MGFLKGEEERKVEKVLLKDLLFNEQKVAKIAAEIFAVWPQFERAKFVREVSGKFGELELKARIGWIGECLRQYLPGDYREAVGVLLRSLPPATDATLTDNDFGDFIYAPYADFVAKNGCRSEDLAFSLAALKEVTMRFSAEDAIRYFINAFPEETLAELLRWTADEHYHVRRLCSEGTRPKLPWATKIGIEVEAALPILERLYADSTRFVTRSVANHLNDIAKIKPDLVIDLLRKWRKAGKQKPKELDYMTRHALRTLVKLGDGRALELLGFAHDLAVKVEDFRVSEKVKIGEALEFSFAIEADGEAVVDYLIYFQNKAGKMAGKKVFKLKALALKAGRAVLVTKRHLLRGDMTTRQIYPGAHALELQVNGKVLARAEFEVLESSVFGI